jgi:pyrroloquinoline quinone biosynthesis protein B
MEWPCCLGVRDRESGALLLVEATPAVEAQSAMLHGLAETGPRGRRPVDGVLLSHAHIGHYAGLLQFGKEVAAVEGLPVYCTPRMAGFVRGNAPWSSLATDGHLELVEIQPCGSGVFEPLAGLSVEAIVVPHRDEFSDTVAFRLRGPWQTLLWAPDVDRWSKHEGLLEQLLDGVDVAYLDGTFLDESEVVGRDLGDIPHPLMSETMTLLADVAMACPGRIQFIHLNHTNRAMRDAGLVAEIEAKGFRVPETGAWAGL